MRPPYALLGRAHFASSRSTRAGWVWRDQVASPPGSVSDDTEAEVTTSRPVRGGGWTSSPTCGSSPVNFHQGLVVL